MLVAARGHAYFRYTSLHALGIGTPPPAHYNLLGYDLFSAAIFVKSGDPCRSLESRRFSLRWSAEDATSSKPIYCRVRIAMHGAQICHTSRSQCWTGWDGSYCIRRGPSHCQTEYISFHDVAMLGWLLSKQTPS